MSTAGFLILVFSSMLIILIFFFGIIDYLKWHTKERIRAAKDMQYNQHQHELEVLRRQQDFEEDQHAAR